MQNSQKTITIPSVQRPKGGGAIKGIGETFQATPFTGAGSFSIPLEIPVARGLEPDLTLSYNSGGSQGIFGLGFSLSVPTISRRTEKRLPNYSEADEFVLSNADYLVPALKQDGSGWVVDEFIRTDEITSETYQVRRYRPRTEGRFLRIEWWIREADGDSYWRVMTPEGLTNVYGKSRTAKIVHPDQPQQVFQWRLEATEDSLGNKIKYYYKAEDNQNIETCIFENNRGKPTQTYLHKIQYGNYFDQQGIEQWSFSLVFDYGDYDLQKLTEISTTPTQLWKQRTDPFSDYRAGFEIRTHRLCYNILVFHHFEAELGVRDCLVRGFKLTYNESPVLSFLTEVEQVGYRRNSDGSYQVKSLPGLRFKYSSYDPVDHQFQPLSVDQQTTLSDQFNQQGYQLVDLYGEGIAGVLLDRNGTTLYWRPQGNGNYGNPHSLPAFPIERNHRDRPLNYTITDGLWTWLTVRSLERSGFYQLESEENWQGWQNFDQIPGDYFHPEAEFADVTGNGYPDILLFEEDRVKVYPGVRQAGHEPAITALRDAALPMRETTVGADEKLILADMGGDGLSDRVWIRNGMVTYFPNLGYGKFGAAIVMENSPIFEDRFEASRLFFADIDGSGTSDLIYVQSDGIWVYFNQSGNRFSDPIQIPLPGGYHSGCRIQLADILGNGTTCFVFSYGTQEIFHQFYDFTGGVKPHLLTEIDNQMGALTRIQYAASTQFYLQDRKVGKPWITQLPFPVQVVEKIETIDQIADSKQVKRYAYHHGGYDFREREFAGFGLVERWDSEAFAQIGIADSQSYVPPSYTKTWYHTGLAEREESLSRQFVGEYYQGDENAWELADSQFEESGDETRSLQQAYRALRGKVLREEIYGDDHQPGLSEHPYSVHDYAYNLRRIQPIAHQAYSVYLPLEREGIHYQYERTPDDPRITHTFNLDYDRYANLIRTAKIAYSRRHPDYPDQGMTQGIYTYQPVLNLTDSHYRLGLSTEQQTFELGGLQSGEYLTGNEIKQRYPHPEVTGLDFDHILTGVGSRLLSWKQYHYWDDTQTTVLPVGESGWRGLLGYTATAVSSQDTINALFSPFDTETIHQKLVSIDPDGGGFRSQTRRVSDRVYYFDVGVMANYGDKGVFYQPIRFVDQFGTETVANYDHYSLSIVGTEAKLSQTQRLINRVQLDYITLKPSVAIDINQNTTEYLYDALGNVQLVSRYGIEGGSRRGDLSVQNYSILSDVSLDQILTTPAAYLQTATSFFFYDVLAWKREQQPIYAVSLHRDRYSSDDPNSSIQILLDYSDGFGRSLQTKRQAEAGLALRVQGDGTVIMADSNPRWITSGRTVYSNKGAVVKQYEPFYSDRPRYQPESVLTEYGVTAIRYYDPLNRVYRVDLPKGYLTRTHYTPWSLRSYDANDTILESTYYAENNGNLSADEQDALNKAVHHANTLTETQLDVWGRSFRVFEYANSGDDPLVSYTKRDIIGNRLQWQDPRLSRKNLFNFQVSYDMLGQPFVQIGVDNGTHWILYNAGGDVIHRWDSRGFHISTHYDALSRPIETWVEGNGLNQQVERILYGEDSDPTGDRNLRGTIVTHFDRAGKVEFSVYGLDGQWLESQRQFRTSYKAEPDWSQDEELSPETFTITRQFDALNRLTQTLYPDGRQVSQTYHQSGRLNQILMEDSDGLQEIISQIDYNSRHQREQIRYGNGTTTSYRYDEKTFQLIQLQSRRNRDNRIIQDITYTYDPSENITRIRDRSHETIFNTNQIIEPLQDYTYDALYQLTVASGREHPGLYRDRGQSELPDYAQSLNISPNINNAQALQNYTRRFTYDTAGNLTQIQHLGQTSFTRDILISPTSNRLVDADRDTDSLYDANGNILSLNHLRQLDWDYGNQLAAVDIIQRDTGINDSEYYIYDANQQRVRKVSERLVNGQTEIDETFYIGDYELKRIRRGNRISQERTTLSIQEGQERIAIAHRWTIQRPGQTPTQQVRFQLGNHHGSVSLELDSTSNLITYQEYYPFGGTALIAGQNQQEVERKRYQYGGRERDAVTQFYYYGTRYYIPWLGRWLSPDLAGPVDGLNLYQFVRNNPIRFTDDNGSRTVSAGLAKRVAFFESGGQGRSERGIPNGLVSQRISFFEGIANGTLQRGIPPGIVSQRVAQFERLREIPSGLVSQRVAQFEQLSQEGSSRGIQPGLVNQRRGQIERFQEIPRGLVSRRVAQFERRQPDSGSDSTAPNSSTISSRLGDNNQNNTSSTNSGSGFKLSLGTDLQTATLIAAGILVAIELHQQRQDLLNAKKRSRLHRFRDLNNEIRRFNRSRLNPIERDNENNDNSNLMNSANTPLANASISGKQDLGELRDRALSDSNISDEKQEQENSEDEVIQASASTPEKQRRYTL